jgi:uncharacterized protein YuzE
MKLIYDSDRDILQFTFVDRPVEETAQIAPGLILDYDEDGQVIGLELRKASQKVDDPSNLAYVEGEANLNKPQPTVRE